MPELVIRTATVADAGAIAAIYNPYVRETIVTFEEIEVTAAEMAVRIATVANHYPWMVGEADGALIGYAYAARYSDRSAYRHSVSSSIFLNPAYCGKGFGTALYADLLDRLAGQDVHVAVGAISVPNPASIALHEKLGFRKVGQIPEVGFKFGQWLDVAYLHRRFGAP